MLIKFIYYTEIKLSKKFLTNLLYQVDKIKIPNFPYNGQYLKDQGFTEGKEIGHILRELEKEWLDRDFNLNNNEAVFIVNKVKN